MDGGQLWKWMRVLINFRWAEYFQLTALTNNFSWWKKIEPYTSWCCWFSNFSFWTNIFRIDAFIYLWKWFLFFLVFVLYLCSWIRPANVPDIQLNENIQLNTKKKDLFTSQFFIEWEWIDHCLLYFYNNKILFYFSAPKSCLY